MTNAYLLSIMQYVGLNDV